MDAKKLSEEIAAVVSATVEKHLKANPYRDEHGRFTSEDNDTGGGGGSAFPVNESGLPVNEKGKVIPEEKMRDVVSNNISDEFKKFASSKDNEILGIPVKVKKYTYEDIGASYHDVIFEWPLHDQRRLPNGLYSVVDEEIKIVTEISNQVDKIRDKMDSKYGHLYNYNSRIIGRAQGRTQTWGIQTSLKR